MRVAALYDIHGNLPALEAVLTEIAREDPDLVVVGGDVVSGPFPRETLDRLVALGDRARFIRGNADREVVAACDGHPLALATPAEVREEARWVAGQLDRRHRDLLAGWPAHVTVAVDGLGAVLFCHGSPRSDEEILTAISPPERVAEALHGVAQRVVVCGHTHMAFERRVEAVRLVNAGSVGMPYGAPGAYWALLGPEVALRRAPYDREQAAALIRRSGHPRAAEVAQGQVLAPPSVSDALAAFEPAAS